ncbi:MAG: hypothetical protein ABI372_10035 [Ginsengibacter sp.]
MEKFEIKGLKLGILKYLFVHEPSKSEGYNINTFTRMHLRLFVESRAEFNNAIGHLESDSYIEIHRDKIDHYSITEKGRDYINEYNDFELGELFNGKRDYVILKFLYQMNEPVRPNFFPDSIINDIPASGKGMDNSYYLKTYIDFESSLKKYVTNDDKKGIEISPLGKKYFDHLREKNKKDLEIENKPLINLDFSTHSSGSGSTFISHSNLSNSLNKKQETVTSKEIDEKSYKLNRSILIWTIIGIIVAIAIALWIAYR